MYWCDVTTYDGESKDDGKFSQASVWFDPI